SDRDTERLGLCGRAIPDGQLVPCVDQPPRDAAAHPAEPDDRDLRHAAIIPDMGLGHLAAFLGVSLVVIVTPGQDTALTIRITIAWLTLTAFSVARARAVLLRSRVRRALDALAGLVLVSFGVRLASER